MSGFAGPAFKHQSNQSINHSQRSHCVRGAPDPAPDPAGYPVNLVNPAGSNVSGSGSDPVPAGSQVGSGKY